MAERKAFALRLRADVFNALRRWADDDMRSVNAQIEFLLRDALLRKGRLPAPDGNRPIADETSGDANA
ncbi:Arc family DNA-binding protein [Sinimarinibacterium sp. CAU 1509]|uniref:Arc family DNA-binding protein n=1 Tax=Sinimarinibacterium sp. CAU 1509 TaxID=2562283 RepID=UPI0010ABB26A|nr:Arc family DNA-binding protein [Sinimarinibacterium sp. CAU 1509]TJY62123.1 Arc family DNA-binding protein [Sinimarinibacterium sp. CAU 1509]